MKIGLFGGTFDPVHNGHLAAAHAAAERCGLDRILFVPSDVPPHKQKQPITDFAHRYAMVTLALQGEKVFLPSLLESPESGRNQRPHYSIDTVRRVKQSLKASDRLFFILGIDAFMDIADWHEPEALLEECEFIVVSRPGSYLLDVIDALPASLRPKTVVRRASGGPRPVSTLTFHGVTLHLLEGVNFPVAASDIRTLIARGEKWERLVKPPVAEYIKKMKLYVPSKGSQE